jgi:putative hemolysin
VTDGGWLMTGIMPVSELKARLDIRDLPEEDRGRYNAVATCCSRSRVITITGEHVACAGWLFEIDLDGKRIDGVSDSTG